MKRLKHKPHFIPGLGIAFLLISISVVVFARDISTNFSENQPASDSIAAIRNNPKEPYSTLGIFSLEEAAESDHSGNDRKPLLKRLSLLQLAGVTGFMFACWLAFHKEEATESKSHVES